MPLTVGFTDTSTNTPTSWSWNFGDSTLRPPRTRAIPTRAGPYTVALTAYNQYGNNTNTKTNYITVGNRPGGKLLRYAHHGARAAGGELHRLLHELPDRMVVDLRGHQHEHGAESEPYLHHGGRLYGGADGDNQYGNNTNTKSNYITVTCGGRRLPATSPGRGAPWPTGTGVSGSPAPT